MSASMMLRATASPWSMAWPTLSSRMPALRPWGNEAQSPAAQTWGAEVRPKTSTRDAVVAGDPGALGEAGVGLRRRRPPARGRRGARCPSVRRGARDAALAEAAGRGPTPSRMRTPWRLVERAEVVRGLGRGDPLQDARRHLDHGDVEPALGADRRRLEADVAAAHHQDAPPGAELGREAVGVGHVAHHEDAVERRRRWPRAGGAGRRRWSAPARRRGRCRRSRA